MSHVQVLMLNIDGVRATITKASDNNSVQYFTSDYVYLFYVLSVLCVCKIIICTYLYCCTASFLFVMQMNNTNE